MKKLVIVLIVLLVLVLTILIGGGIYAYITLKPFLITPSVDSINQNINATAMPVDKHPLLTPSQETTLEKVGIDPAKLPTTITPAMEACFITKLGIDRVNAIKAGESPNAIDLFKAKSCLN